jgi:hypothetical protein
LAPAAAGARERAQRRPLPARSAQSFRSARLEKVLTNTARRGEAAHGTGLPPKDEGVAVESDPFTPSDEFARYLLRALDRQTG